MRFAITLAILGLVAGCNPGRTDQARVVTGTAQAVDHVPIIYDVRGQGDTALVFVHCWSCDRTFWKYQLDAFANNYRVVAIDLPGHGESGADRDSWTIAGLGDDVARVVEQLGLRRVILIGHSMGGPVSLEAARRLRGRVLGVVAVDTLHNAEFEYPQPMIEAWIASFEEDFDGTMERSIRGMISTEADPELADWVVMKAKNAHPEVAIALIRQFPDFDAGAALRAAQVPVRAVNAAPRPEGGLPTAVEINRKYADFDAMIMEGVGHFIQLEHPGEFNEHLRHWIEELDKA